MGKQDEEKLALILTIVGYVENSKSIHLSDIERTTLAVQILHLDEPVATTRRRAEAVCRTKDYGRMSFDIWMQAEPVYSRSEVARMIEEEINRRREAFINFNGFDERKLMEAGLQHWQVWASVEYEKELEKRKEELRLRINSHVKWLMAQPDEVQLKFFRLLQERHLMKSGEDEDPHWKHSIKYFVPYILKDVEQYRKEVEDGGKE